MFRYINFRCGLMLIIFNYFSLTSYSKLHIFNQAINISWREKFAWLP